MFYKYLLTNKKYQAIGLRKQILLEHTIARHNFETLVIKDYLFSSIYFNPASSFSSIAISTALFATSNNCFDFSLLSKDC